MRDGGIVGRQADAGMATTTARRRISTLLVVVALLVLAVMLARWGQCCGISLHNEAGRYDFSSYYAAAAALRANIHANIYDNALIGQVGIAAHTLVAPPLPYTYPPLFAILLSPFTAVSFRVLSRIWLFGNFALWLFIICCCWRARSPSSSGHGCEPRWASPGHSVSRCGRCCLTLRRCWRWRWLRC